MIRVIGNLDCELEWAGKGTLPRAVLERISAAATLLTVFRPDRLWTPMPVEPSRLSEHLPRVELESSPLETLEPATHVLAWGQTGRARGTPLGPDERRESNRLFAAPVAPAEVAQRVNDKRFAHRLAAELGSTLPGARIIRSLEDVVSPGESWVVKAPFSASGRNRVIGRGRLQTAARNRVQVLLSQAGEAILEPWVERTDDFGATGVVTTLGFEDVKIHRLEVRSGTFAGIAVTEVALTRTEERLADKTICAVGEALAREGYRGPAGIDFFRYVSGGQAVLHPLSEINARLTFGWVARAFSEDLARPLALRFGHLPTGDRIIPLIRGGSRDPTAAWLDLHP